jgi:integrase
MPNPIEYKKYGKKAYLLKFVRPDKCKRTTMRLGTVSKTQAVEVGLKISQLLAIIKYGAALPPDLHDWLARLDDNTYSKLVKGGLVAQRVAVPVSGLEKFVTDYCREQGESGAWSPRTREIRSQCVRDLVTYFDAHRELSSITAGDADDWSRWLQKPAPEGKGLARPTIAKRVKDAKQFFGYAVRKKLVLENPFQGIRVASQDNPDRTVEIPRELFERVLAQISDPEVRLIVALGRYGGFRIPSEPLKLLWGDIDFENRSLRIAASKTAVRHCPLFDELLPFFLAVRPESPAPGSNVLVKYLGSNCQYRELFKAAIKQVGGKVWPRLFHNLRANAFTDLCDRNSMPQVCKWLGNSVRVGEKHYLIIRKKDYRHGQWSPAQPTAGKPTSELPGDAQ